MFRARVVEAPLPTARRDLDSLVAWLIDAFALVRRSGPASADGGRASPVHRLLREHVLLDHAERGTPDNWPTTSALPLPRSTTT